jgi:hypothetical protein
MERTVEKVVDATHGRNLQSGWMNDLGDGFPTTYLG